MFAIAVRSALIAALAIALTAACDPACGTGPSLGSGAGSQTGSTPTGSGGGSGAAAGGADAAVDSGFAPIGGGGGGAGGQGGSEMPVGGAGGGEPTGGAPMGGAPVGGQMMGAPMCAVEDEPPSCAPREGGPIEPSGDPQLAPFTEPEFESILRQRCGFCHNPTFAGTPMKIPGTFAAETFGVPASTCGGMNRIERGDPEHSYLYIKVRGTHCDAGGGGVPMPPEPGPMGAVTLTADELERLRLFILNLE